MIDTGVTRRGIHTVGVLSFLCLISSLILSSAVASEAKGDVTILPISELNWTPLNPLRGALGPQAGTTWGNRSTPEATGFLVQFRDGFSSPPHIHNVSYRGVVIAGLVHNDDPNAAFQWMPPGSFWTQPAGEIHITAAQGERNVAYIEIDQGPYLVQPSEDAFDNGERPVNVDPSNMVWLDASDSEWITGEGIELAMLWEASGDNKQWGGLLRFSAAHSARIQINQSNLKAVVIKGSIEVKNTALGPGSYFEANAGGSIEVKTLDQSVLYVRSTDRLKITVN